MSSLLNIAARPAARSGRSVHAHVRMIRLMRLILPASALALGLVLLIWPFLRDQVSGLTLAISEVDSYDDKLRTLAPEFTARDGKGRNFVVRADNAYRVPDARDRVILERVEGDIRDPGGTWLAMNAQNGTYMLKDELLHLAGSVDLYTNEGFELHSTDVDIDLDRAVAYTQSDVYGQAPGGTFRAGAMVMDATGEVIRFSEGVRVVLFPRAIEKSE